MSILLDASQADAVGIDASGRQLVTAGPGSGKTEVVSRLIENLVANGVEPTDGLVVISFSNAAVFAADARLRERGGSPVSTRTLDSLASRALYDLTYDDVTHLGFDGRIERAAAEVREGGWPYLEDIEHLIVDEAQDIVGVRADFVLALLARLSPTAGFTFLGDLAQGIYDFQIRTEIDSRPPRSTTTSQELLHRISQFEGVRHIELPGQYRAVSRDARSAALLREHALNGDRSGEIADFRAGLVPMGQVEEVVALARSWSGTTALLTANNGQALLVARALRDEGAQVQVRRSAQQQVLAGWIARVLGEAPDTTLSRLEFTMLVQTHFDNQNLDVGPLWRALRAISRARGTELDTTALAMKLQRPYGLPPEVLDQPSAPLIVSTVHRAKGLEFDNVVLVDSLASSWFQESIDPTESTRTQFVALTRARHRIASATGPDDRKLRRDDFARWYESGPKRWMTFGFEFRVGDIDRSEPVGSSEVARILATACGRALEFRLDPHRSTLQRPVYSATVDGIPVARTSEAFGHALARRVRPGHTRRNPWPELSSLRVDSLTTVAAAPKGDGRARNGLWLAPVVSGMIRLNWKGTSS